MTFFIDKGRLKLVIDCLLIEHLYFVMADKAHDNSDT